VIIICPTCRQQLQVTRSALNKKVRCPICSETFVATLPKAEVIEELPPQATASDILPIALTTQPQAQTPPEPSSDDPLAQLAAAGMQRKRRRRAGTSVRKTAAAKAADAKKALESFAQRPPQAAAGAQPAQAKPNRPAAQKAAPRRQPASKDAWYVVAGDYEYGPYAPQEILAAIQAGKIAPAIQLRHALTDSVITAGQILQVLSQQQKKTQPPVKEDRRPDDT